MAKGRPPETGITRSEVLCARFGSDTIAKVDAARGDRSRSAFVREAVAEKIKRGGGAA